MITKPLHFRKRLGLVLIVISSLASFQSCKNSKISAAGNSIYANPDTITFSKEHLQSMLRMTYQNFYHTVPASDLKSIEDAADEDAARTAYEVAIESFVDSGLMQSRWRDYAYTALGVGSNAGAPKTRYPANLWTKVLLSGDKMDEFLLADYAVDDNGATTAYVNFPPNPANTPPDNIKAGYTTMEVWVGAYVNQFKFKAIREILGFNLCVTAPISKPNFFSWSETEINNKYLESGGIRCYDCHKNLNGLRYAWHEFGSVGFYSANQAQSVNQYGQEDGFGSQTTLEPRATPAPAGTGNAFGVMPEAEAISTMYKLTEDGDPITSPKDLALAVSKHDEYPGCMVERFLSVILNAPEGSNGTGYVVPNNFSQTAAQVAFKEKWTSTFKEDGQIPKTFFKKFLKSSDYLVMGYTPSGQ